MTTTFVEQILNRFPEVRWDRWSGELADKISIFGWVQPSEQRADYVLLLIDNEGACFISTSSAAYSRAFAARLGFTGSHKDCQRVEHTFPNVNAIKL